MTVEVRKYDRQDENCAWHLKSRSEKDVSPEMIALMEFLGYTRSVRFTNKYYLVSGDQLKLTVVTVK